MPDFVQPLYADPPIIDGVVLPQAFATTRAPQKGHVNLLGTADQGTIIQIAYRGPATPEASAYYQWAWSQRASDEDGWNTITSVISFGRPVWFVPHDVVTETFLAVASQTEFTLGRFIANAKEPLFDNVSNPHRVFLDGVEQTIVASSPSSGEASLAGKTVTTPALSVGQKLEARYYPAYAVVLPPPAQNLLAFNTLDRQLIAIETPLQEPS